MKTLSHYAAYIAAGLAGLAVAFCSFGCVTSTTTAKDGSVTVTKAPAPGVLPFAAAAIVAYSPRAIVVKEEKSGPMRRHLFSWRGQQEIAHTSGTERITKEEIEKRRR